MSVQYSVIIPVYNGKDYLADAVASVYRQHVSDFEIVLVDDGSTDGSGEICDKFAAEDARVKVIHQKNAYLGAARNRGFERASGKYVLFLDADDILCDGVLEAAFLFDGADIICSNRFYAYDCRTGKESVRTGDFSEGMELRTVNTRLAAFSPYTAQSVYRREFVERSGVRFEETRINSEDRVWTVRLIHLSKRTAVLDRPLYRYTEHRAGSLMNRMTAAYILDSLKALETLYEEADGFDYDPVDAVKEKIANEFLCFCACAALVRDREIGSRTMAYVREHLSILGSRHCAARPFLWLRRVIGLRNLLKLCNAVFLHYTTDR